MDLTGQTYGRLTVLKEGQKPRKGTPRYWTCRCECGSVYDYLHGNLRGGRATQCRDCGNKQLVQSLTKHGMCGSALYEFHRSLKQTGQLCPEWHDFTAFYAAVGDRPRYKRLYRLDAAQPLGPGNWEWSTAREHGDKRRDVVRSLLCGMQQGGSSTRMAKIVLLRRRGFTLQEIGDVLGMSRERVRQIQAGVKMRIARLRESVVRHETSLACFRADLAMLEADGIEGGQPC
jgi:hypothetical protein